MEKPYEVVIPDSARRISQYTFRVKEKLWMNNLAENVVKIRSGRDVKDLPRRNGEPAIVIAAGPSVQTVLPHINITTLAIKIPTTLMHLHVLNVIFDKNPETDNVKAVLEKAPRIRFVSAAEGITSTASIIELGRDLSRPRYDMWENCIWEESISINDELYFFQAIHQESIVIPETILNELLGDPETVTFLEKNLFLDCTT